MKIHGLSSTSQAMVITSLTTKFCIRSITNIEKLNMEKIAEELYFSKTFKSSSVRIIYNYEISSHLLTFPTYLYHILKHILC